MAKLSANSGGFAFYIVFAEIFCKNDFIPAEKSYIIIVERGQKGRRLMRILIDADGCPVVDEAVSLAQEFSLECIILCDTAHYFNREGARTVVLSQGADSVDFALVNMVKAGDIVVTQDYGLAAMCLARKSRPIHQNGMLYPDGNIDGLLASRHTAQKIRRGGGRTKGPSRRTKEQDMQFTSQLRKLIAEALAEEHTENCNSGNMETE